MNKEHVLPSQSRRSNDSNPLGTTVTQTYVGNPASLWWSLFSLCICKQKKSTGNIFPVCTNYENLHSQKLKDMPSTCNTHLSKSTYPFNIQSEHCY